MNQNQKKTTTWQTISQCKKPILVTAATCILLASALIYFITVDPIKPMFSGPSPISGGTFFQPESCQSVIADSFNSFTRRFATDYPKVSGGRKIFASKFFISKNDLKVCLNSSSYANGIRVYSAINTSVAPSVRCFILSPMKANYQNLTLTQNILCPERNLCPLNCDFSSGIYNGTSTILSTCSLYTNTYYKAITNVRTGVSGVYDDVLGFMIQDKIIKEVLANSNNIGISCEWGYDQFYQRKLLIYAINPTPGTLPNYYLENETNLCPLNCD